MAAKKNYRILNHRPNIVLVVPKHKICQFTFSVLFSLLSCLPDLLQ